MYAQAVGLDRLVIPLLDALYTETMLPNGLLPGARATFVQYWLPAAQQIFADVEEAAALFPAAFRRPDTRTAPALAPRQQPPAGGRAAMLELQQRARDAGATDQEIEAALDAEWRGSDSGSDSEDSKAALAKLVTRLERGAETMGSVVDDSSMDADSDDERNTAGPSRAVSQEAAVATELADHEPELEPVSVPGPGPMDLMDFYSAFCEPPPPNPTQHNTTQHSTHTHHPPHTTLVLELCESQCDVRLDRKLLIKL